MNTELVPVIIPAIITFFVLSSNVGTCLSDVDYRYVAGYQFGCQEGQNAKQSGDQYDPKSTGLLIIRLR